MLFSSLTFLFIFLPFMLLLYHIIKDKYKNLLLFLGSLLFYSWGEPKYIILMLISILVNYCLALLISILKKNKNKKIVLLVSILLNIGLLLIFKYSNFILFNFNNIFNISIPLINITLPIGISFYTFQILSYVIDVYNKKVEAQRNILILGTYIALFPQLIAGPIVRYSDIEKQLKNRKSSRQQFANGVQRFIIGLSKKVIIANNVAIISDTIFNSSKLLNYGWIILVIGTLSYTFQIYFDFSGYSDMAIGLGKMFGFEFLENFNYPYISTSITEFWRRWHISLSSWFKDYVYIPLGGNKTSKIKCIRNIFTVWILTGLWHGANWNFVLWGLYFALLLILEKQFLGKYLKKIPVILQWVYSFILINIGWIIFRIDNVDSIFAILKNIFIFKKFDTFKYLSSNFTLINYLPYFFLAIIFSFPIGNMIYKKANKSKYLNKLYNLILIGMFIICIFLLLADTYNPFIYFRF